MENSSEMGIPDHLTCLLRNLYAEYIIGNVGLEEAQAGIKIARENINKLRYADDITFMAESEELKNFPQFIVIHTVKGFSIVNKAEMQFLFCFSFSRGSPHISSAHLWGLFVFPTQTTLFPMDVL